MELSKQESRSLAGNNKEAEQAGITQLSRLKYIALKMLKTRNSGSMMVSSIREVEKTLRDGMRWEGGSGWGTRVHLWRIHVNVWQNQYNIVISLSPGSSVHGIFQARVLSVWGAIAFSVSLLVTIKLCSSSDRDNNGH